ncbi:MAG: hypothetical protein IPM22_08290 [Betaproteobacteria bacterium]|nr:hypothetical protein [Betaproteobacteria bacterium]MCC7216945.1 hypothetical protein [Burkholderiales bacterium]
MEKLVYAAVGFALGAAAGAVAAFLYMEEDFAAQQRTTLILHGDRRAVACQVPEAQRPKGLDCRGLTQ